MYSKLLFIASLAVATMASKADDTTILAGHTTVVSVFFDDDFIPMTNLVALAEQTSQPLAAQIDSTKHQMPQAVPQVVSASLPISTAAKLQSSQAASLQYLPTPMPMPTTTPHYPDDFPAAVRAAIASNMAKADKDINTTLTLRDWEASALTPLLASITSLQAITSAASAAMVTLSWENLFVKSIYSSARSELSDRRHELDELLPRNGGATLSVFRPSTLIVSLIVAIGFAGLAVVL